MYIQMTDTYGRVWLVPAAVQFQPYGLRDFLNDLASSWDSSLRSARSADKSGEAVPRRAALLAMTLALDATIVAIA